MKTKRIWIIAGIVLAALLGARYESVSTRPGLFSPVDATSAQELVEPFCTDSDGGLVYETAGYVEGVGPAGYPYTKADACETDAYAGYLREFYCSGASPLAKRYLCGEGCMDGACIASAPTPEPATSEPPTPEPPTPMPAASEPSCTDSDGGLVYNVAGYVSGTGSAGYPYAKADACEVDAYEGYLREYYCSGASALAKRYLCGEGCADGACLVPAATTEPPTPEPPAPEPSCTDFDGDGFAVEGGNCGETDCDDGNPLVNPGRAEDCGNGIDDNCNGLADDADPFCSGPPNIIVVGWDGLQRDHFWQCYNKELPECAAGLPNISQLEIRSLTITNGASETKPGWAQLFTGYNAEVTGVYDNGTYRPIPVGYTVFEKVENQPDLANIVTMFVSGKDVHTGGACIGDPTTKNGLPVVEDLGQPWCHTKDYLDYYINGTYINREVGEKALELLETHRNDPIFALFLFRDPDVTGHVAGENSTSYSKAILDTDAWLGRIIDQLKALGMYERTLLYVVSDHGFGEGLTTHGNAPYTIFASNDPGVANRTGDRKDLAPTILEQYGISTGQIGAAPPVNGHSLYAPPPFSTVPEGEAFLDYPEAPACSADLSLIGLIRRLSSVTCILPTGGTGDDSGYCTACGNGTCEVPENRCNCPVDCTR